MSYAERGYHLPGPGYFIEGRWIAEVELRSTRATDYQLSG
jgi:hypothetical protein